MKRTIATLSVFPFAAFTAWLGGYDFDQRNAWAAYAFIVTCMAAVLVWACPFWSTK